MFTFLNTWLYSERNWPEGIDMEDEDDERGFIRRGGAGLGSAALTVASSLCRGCRDGIWLIYIVNPPNRKLNQFKLPLRTRTPARSGGSNRARS